MSHVVYRLLPADYGRYRERLLTLDADSRYLRFGCHMKDEIINSLCDGFSTNYTQHKIFVIEDADLNVIAAAHISTVDDPIEIALSVLKAHQQQGMGSTLMRRCIEWCQNRGIEHGSMVCLASNTAVRKLAKRHGVLIVEDGEALAEIKIPVLNSVSVFNETVDTGLSHLDHMSKLQMKFANTLTNILHFK